CIAFFFSSRRRHTRSKRDWSSDVCSSDLRRLESTVISSARTENRYASRFSVRALDLTVDSSLLWVGAALAAVAAVILAFVPRLRSEERRVGEGCRSRCARAGAAEAAQAME